MPRDPLPASSPGKLPTNEVDIGHVAPSFADEELWNTFVIRPQYRLSLRMGDIERLFKHEPGTEDGRMERLQVLGLFYWPLNHTKARQAFRGRPAQPANAGTGAPAVPATVGAWEYFWRKILGHADDSQADQEIQRMLRERILDGLPSPPTDPANPTRDNFEKIRIPGGYAILNSWQSLFLNFNVDPAYSFSLGDDLYALETRFRNANPALGKVPLVATVEKLDPYTMEWKPAKDVWVYFQLIDPDPLPAFDPAMDVTDPRQFNRPALRESTLGPPAANSGAGPATAASGEENPTGALAPNASDPQRRNTHHQRGGRRGHGSLTDCTDVAGVIFPVASTPGFNAAHSPARASVTAPFLNVAERARPQGTSHQHAVRAKTNDQGEAGVIFLPSRCGGDSYKLRAYIGPADPANPRPHETDGTGIRATRVDTGTLVVWRNIRISRYVKQPCTGVAADLLAGAQAAPYSDATANDYLRRVFVVDSGGTNVGIDDVDMSLRVRAGFSNRVAAGDPFDSLPVNFAKAFCEIEFDPGANAAEAMTDADWANARATAVADAAMAQSAIGCNYDLARLFYLEPGAPAITMSDAVCNVPMRTPAQYDALVASPRQTTDPGNSPRPNGQRLFFEFICTGFARYFSNSGYVPGLCIVQGGYGATWQILHEIDDNSGMSLEYRVGTVWAGKAFYSDTNGVRVFGAGGAPPQGPPWIGYNTTSNACHELGHVMLRLHGPGADVNRGAGGGNSAAVHDAINNSICVMSYKSCEGQYCAKCLFAFRGWTNLP